MKCCGVRVGNTAAQRAWSNNQRHLFATRRCSLTVGVEAGVGGGAGVAITHPTPLAELINRVIEG